MADEAAPLEYASAKRHRRRWPYAIVGGMILATAAFFPAGRRIASATQWLSDVNDRRAVLRGFAATGTLDLTSNVAGDGVGPFLNEFSSRARAWSGGGGAASAKLWNLTRPRPTASPGNPAVAFAGKLLAADGTERFAVVGLNVSVKHDVTEACVQVDVELHAIGTWRVPAFTVVPPKAAAAAGSTIRCSEPHHWASFDILQYRPGDAVTFGAPSVAADDPATLLLPVTIGGIDETFRFTLGAGDVVTASRERKASTTQPATRSAA